VLEQQTLAVPKLQSNVALAEVTKYQLILIEANYACMGWGREAGFQTTIHTQRSKNNGGTDITVGIK
jgi:hypothetical protein